MGFFNRKSTAFEQATANLEERLKRSQADFEEYKSSINRDVLEMADLHSKMRRLYLRFSRMQKIDSEPTSTPENEDHQQEETELRTPREIRDAICKGMQ